MADPAPVVLDTVEMGVGDAMVDGDAAAGADTRAGGEGEGSRWPCPPACPCTTTRLAEGAVPPVGSGVVAGMGGVAPGVFVCGCGGRGGGWMRGVEGCVSFGVHFLNQNMYFYQIYFQRI